MHNRPLATALIAGLVSATGFAPLDWWPVTLIAVAVVLRLVWRAATLRRAALIGWLFGVGHFTVGNNWIQHAFDYQDKMPPALGYIAVVLLALYLAVYPALALAAAWWFDRRVRRRAPWREIDPGFLAAAAAAWIATEWMRATFFTGYAWNPLGVLWLPLPVAQSAAWVGTYALSGVAVLAAGALALLPDRDWRGAAAMIAPALALSLAAVGVPPVALPEADAPRVRVVQPNIGQDGVLEDPDGYAERVLARLIAMSGTPGRAPRLVVWPEGMVNQLIEDGYPQPWYWRGQPDIVRRRIASVLGPRDMALVSGNAVFFGPDQKPTGAGNSVFPITPDGRILGRYDKAHLVPYGEYLPMRSLLEPLGLARLVMGNLDFVPGPGPATLGVPGFGQVGVQVCYEIIFSGQVVDAAHRPDLIFNPSNDAWFGSWGPPQHLAQARLRAIEEGLPILRATPTGISAVIDANGRLIATVPLYTQGAIDAPLPRAHAATLFSHLGNWAALAAALLLAASAIAFRRLSR